MKKLLLIVGVLVGISTGSLVHSYTVELVNNLDKWVAVQVHNASAFCRNIHKKLKPGETYREKNGICNVRKVTGQVLDDKGEKVEAIIPLKFHVWGRTGLKVDKYIVWRSSFGPEIILENTGTTSSDTL